MVKASVNLEGDRFELDSVEGGYVVLKRMTYGQKLYRQQSATNQTVRSQGKGRSATTEMDIDLLARKVAEYEFAHCIVDHNLDDENDNKFDFNKPDTIDKLDPRIGDEISKLIGNMNNFDEDDEEGN